MWALKGEGLHLLIYLSLVGQMCMHVWLDAGSKRGREEDNEENRTEGLHATSNIKKSRHDPTQSLQVNIFICMCLQVSEKVQCFILKYLCKVSCYIGNNLDSALWYQHVCFLSQCRFCGCVAVFDSSSNVLAAIAQSVYFKHILLLLWSLISYLYY